MKNIILQKHKEKSLGELNRFKSAFYIYIFAIN